MSQTYMPLATNMPSGAQSSTGWQNPVSQTYVPSSSPGWPKPTSQSKLVPAVVKGCPALLFPADTSIQKFHGVVSLIMWVNFVVCLVFAIISEKPMDVGIWVYDMSDGTALTGCGQTGTTPVDVFNRLRFYHVGHVRPRLCACLFFLVTAIAETVYASGFFYPYLSAVIETRYNPYRWIEYSVSATIMIIPLMRFCGDADIFSLLAKSTLNVAMMFCGNEVERYRCCKRDYMANPNTTDGKDLTCDRCSAPRKFFYFWMGSLFGVIPWVSMITSFATGPVLPAIVYTMFTTVIVAYFSFAVVSFLEIRVATGSSGRKTYARTETNYTMLSTLSKTVLGYQLIFAG